jgi:hypothetical protein
MDLRYGARVPPMPAPNYRAPARKWHTFAKYTAICSDDMKFNRYGTGLLHEDPRPAPETNS